jgi:hypothetical protein
MQKRNYILYSIFVIFALFLIFYRLDYPFLWVDEADTAVLGKRIMAFGVPKVWDGRNFVMPLMHPHMAINYTEFNSNLVHRMLPWPQFYIAAASISIFGNNTLACRLPFALIGLICFIYYLSFCGRYLKLGRLYYLPGLLLLFSIPFFLHVRQCRYYSLNIFLTLLFVDSFILLTRKKKYSPLYFALAGTAFIFITTGMALIPLLCAFALYILFKPKKRFDLKYMLKGLGFLAIGCMLFLAFRIYIVETSIPMIFQFGLLHFLSQLFYYVNGINSWFFPLIILLILIILILVNRDKNYKYEVSDVFKNDLLHLFGLIVILQLIFFANLIGTQFRYLIHIVPFLLMLLAYALFLIYKKNKLIYALVLLCFLFTDLIGRCATRLPFFALAKIAKKNNSISSLLTNDRFINYTAACSRTPLAEGQTDRNKNATLTDFIAKYEKIDMGYPYFVFLRKITKPYPDVNTCIVKFLMKNSKKDEIVVTNYAPEPIMFYTDLITRGGPRAIGLGLYHRRRIGGISTEFFRQLGISEVKNPRWVLVRKNWQFQDELMKIVSSGSYKKIVLDCPDSPWGNNPNPNYYIYGDTSGGRNVTIYKRVD